MKHIIISIDCDVNLSGVCIIIDGELEYLNCMKLWDVFIKLESIKSKEHIVIIEAGWLNKNRSWHGGGKGSAYDVGRNHEIGIQIEKFCKDHKINYRLEKPRGYSSVSHDTFMTITEWKHIKRTNPETRVAGLFAFHELQRMKLLDRRVKK
jgi:hypothetical protein